MTAGVLELDGGLRLADQGSDPVVTRARDLIIRTGSTNALDLGRNALLIDYTGDSPLDRVVGYIENYFNGGGWDEQFSNGLTSRYASTAAGLGVGYVEASTLDAIPAAFAGEAIDATALLVMLTQIGDADLDLDLDLGDLESFRTHFGSEEATWRIGDWNYDRVTDYRDFNLLGARFGLEAQASGPTEGEWSALFAAVIPEPTSAVCLLLLLGAGARRYRSTER